MQPAESFRLGMVSAIAMVLGVLGAATAWLVYHFIGLLYNFFFFQRFSFEFVEPPTTGLPYWIIVVPALGGLICGLLARYGSTQIIGHGIPEAMQAVWTNFSRVKARIFFLKPFSAAIAIGTGAPFGVEGPIIQGGGALGSIVGQFLSTSAEERKVMLACGAAAGMAATFNTPLAAILVAIELLVFEFRSRSFVPITIASIIATQTRRIILGDEVMFKLHDVTTDLFANLPYLILLGIVLAFAAIAFRRSYFWAEAQIHRIPVNDVLLPALGGLVFGCMGFLVPRTFGVGYEVIGEILNDELTVGLVFAVMMFKLAGVTLTLGSKTSGGFLAPVFVGGAAIGSLFAHAVNFIVPAADLPVSLFALSGLGVLFGVLCNATFGFTIFALEASGHFEALVPVFLVAAVANGFAKKFMKTDLMTAELRDRGVDVHQEFQVDLLQRFRVGEVMELQPPTLAPTTRVADLLQTLSAAEDRGERRVANGWAIIDDDGALVGVVTYGDIVRSLAAGASDATVLEAGTTDLLVAHADQRLWAPVALMAQKGINQVPVVSRNDHTELLGWVDFQDLIASALAQLAREQVREDGWAASLLRRRRS